MILALEEIDVFEQFLVYSFSEPLLELAGEFLHEMREALLRPVLLMTILQSLHYGRVELSINIILVLQVLQSSQLFPQAGIDRILARDN